MARADRLTFQAIFQATTSNREDITMEFGYFTLSDNNYKGNTRTANQFVRTSPSEALYADQLGMHSAWIGEHHFNSLGVNSSPEMVLAYHRRAHQAYPARARGHGAAAAQSDPRRRAMGDARSSVRRARRFRRRPRLRPPRISAVRHFVRRQPGDLRRGRRNPPQALELGRQAHRPQGQALPVRGCRDHAAADPEPDAALCGVLLQALDRACRAAQLRPDRRPVRGRHELRRTAAGLRPLSRELRQIRPQAGPADVQLLHPFRRQCRAGEGRSASARSAITRNA